MPEFLLNVVASSAQASAGEVLLRLMAALVYGLVIAFVYRWTRGREAGSAFSMTLVLLSVLIAMVTQVIGDNVARAFSLVGALSIVRFRTVVKDTQDTAYVILAVIVGMAVGSWSLWVATIGIGVVALAEGLSAMGFQFAGTRVDEYELKVRAGVDQEVDRLVKEATSGLVDSIQVVSMGMVKQGECMEATYVLQPKRGVELPQLVSALTVQAGVQTLTICKKSVER